jgi:hypothetical protein
MRFRNRVTGGEFDAEDPAPFLARPGWYEPVEDDDGEDGDE